MHVPVSINKSINRVDTYYDIRKWELPLFFPQVVVYLLQGAAFLPLEVAFLPLEVACHHQVGVFLHHVELFHLLLLVHLTEWGAGVRVLYRNSETSLNNKYSSNDIIQNLFVQ